MLLLVLLAAAPSSSHRFIHFLHGAPVGEIELRRSGPHYEYVSRHFFRRGGGSEERFVPSASDSPTWASESLIRPRAVGCWPVEDELTRQRGEACVTRAGQKTAGTLFGQPFSAVYEKNTLQKLELGDSKFVRSDTPVKFKDPFGEGFALSGSGNALALVPPLKGARTAMPTPSGTNEDCLAAAHAWAKEHPGYDVVLGLIEDEGRGWPHAWVKHRTSGEERDPSRPQTAEGAPRYLALPSDEAPRVFLDLLGKRRALVRVAAP